MADMKSTLIVAVGAILTAAALAAAFLSGASEESSAVQAEYAVEAPDVIMSVKSSRPGCEREDLCYIPSVVAIKAGSAVTWENQDVAFHSVTAGAYGSPTGLFDSGHLDPGEYFTVVLDVPGTYEYHCTLHPWMVGVVLVEGEEGI